MRLAAANFPPSVYDPPLESASNAPGLNLNLAGVNVSLGGPGGAGLYRTSAENSIQADGIRDGVRNLLGKVRQGVDRMGQGL
jgi:vacuolar protein sorting-associated protein 45